jgi:hypothetical protein
MAENETPKGEVATPPSDSPEQRRANYNRAVRTSRLANILLSALEFKVNREITEPSGGRASYGSEIKKFFFDPEDGVLLSNVEWTVEIKVGRRRYIRCSATYDIVYDGFKDIDEEVARLFAENVARPACYSYFRALYAHLDWSADIGSPPLPVVKFQPRV